MSRRIELYDTPLAGLKLLQRKPLGDKRGYLERLFCAEELGEVMAEKPILQINHTLTEEPYTIRGMHFQYAPHTETKLVSCLRGEVFDVAVDLRPESPTFLQWHSEILSAENFKTLAVPDGFAHGFQTLTKNCELIYLHTSSYYPQSEGALNPLDKKLAIDWPENVSCISDRDASHPMLEDGFEGVKL